VPARALLPVFQTLTEALVANGERTAAAEGRAVSCRKGSGACCRQLVPVSEIETRHIRDLVAAMPESRRSAVLSRFAEAIQWLDEAGLLDILRRPEAVPFEERRRLGLEYFGLGIPCPFLEDESCSIHPDRPIVCREYLVTSPAENCARPSPETIDRVALPSRLSGTLARFVEDGDAPRTTWVPLVLALEWAAAHPSDGPPRPGPEWLQTLFRRWAGREVPDAPGADVGS
jgi:Fe-S-cluster containining protein